MWMLHLYLAFRAGPQTWLDPSGLEITVGTTESGKSLRYDWHISERFPRWRMVGINLYGT